jgi:hypothetical protein
VKKWTRLCILAWQAQDIRDLLKMYKGWSYKLFPGMPLDDMVTNIDKLSTTVTVKRTLDEIRHNECERYRQVQVCRLEPLLRSP